MRQAGSRSLMVVVGAAVALLYATAAWLVVRLLGFLIRGGPNLLPTLAVVVVATAVFGVLSLRAGTGRLLASMETVEVTPRRAPEVTRRLDRLVERMGVARPRLLVGRLDSPNALSLATGDGGTVVVDATLFRLLDDDELETILAHELAHFERRDSLVGALAVSTLRTLSGLVLIALLPAFLLTTGSARGLAWMRGRPTEWTQTVPGRFRTAIERGVVGLLFVLTLGLRAHSRRREFAADDRAAGVTGHPLALARALEKIDRAGDPGGLLAPLYTGGTPREAGQGGLLATHPGTDERIARLRGLAGVGGTRGSDPR